MCDALGLNKKAKDRNVKASHCSAFREAVKRPEGKDDPLKLQF